MASGAQVGGAAVADHFNLSVILRTRLRRKGIAGLVARSISPAGRRGDQLEAALAAGTDPDVAPLERFEQYWIRVLDTFASHRRLWAAAFEIFGQVERVPEFRRFVGDALQDARRGVGPHAVQRRCRY